MTWPHPRTRNPSPAPSRCQPRPPEIKSAEGKQPSFYLQCCEMTPTIPKFHTDPNCQFWTKFKMIDNISKALQGKKAHRLWRRVDTWGKGRAYSDLFSLMAFGLKRRPKSVQHRMDPIENPHHYWLEKKKEKQQQRVLRVTRGTES